MKNSIKEHVQTIQKSMLESECVKSCFEEPAQESLRILIRLTVEFYDYLQHGVPGLRVIAESYQHRPDGYIIPPDELKLEELKYSLESIFSGIDEFRRVNSAYSVLVGATKSKVEWGMASMTSLKGQFISMFHEFTVETNFEKKCRILLDLFKIQFVFAGVFYD